MSFKPTPKNEVGRYSNLLPDIVNDILYEAKIKLVSTGKILSTLDEFHDSILNPCSRHFCEDELCLITRDLSKKEFLLWSDEEVEYYYPYIKIDNNITKPTRLNCNDSKYYHCVSCNVLIYQSWAEILLDKISRDGRTIYCINCLRSNSTACWNCQRVISALPIQGPWKVLAKIGKFNHYLCTDCHDSLKECTNCLSRYYESWEIDGECPFCMSEVIKEYNYKPTPVFNGGDSRTYYGFELEVEMKRGFEKTRELIASRFYKDVREIAYLKKDSSLESGFEIVTHPGTFDYWHNPDNALINPLKKLTGTCESFSSDSTGIHVHVSKTAFKHKFHIAKFVSFFYKHAYFSSLIAERYQVTQAPFDIVLQQTGILNLLLNDDVRDRHTAINLWGAGAPPSTCKTIEIRLFKGNMKWSRILKNIEFVDSVLCFTDDKITGKSQAELNEWTDKASLPKYKEFVLGSKRYPNLEEFIAKTEKRG